jgi:hypothetical protein
MEGGKQPRSVRSRPLCSLTKAGTAKQGESSSPSAEDCYRIGTIVVAMALSACTVTVPVSPTSSSSTVTSSAEEMRPLTLNEKTTLAKTLSQTLKEPIAAQFKWLPVPSSSSGPIGYCGLVNIKNSRGGYVGFRRFFAMISKGPKGDYVAGRIEHIDPLASAGTGTQEDAIETALTEDNCKEWGYTGFNAAS